MWSKDSDGADRPAGTAEIRFYAELNDYLPAGVRYTALNVPLGGSADIGGLIAGVGIPLSEVDLILRNGEPARFGDIVSSGDRLSVYPVFETFDIGLEQRLRDHPLRAPAFVLDVHLGKLASFLRMLGCDASYSSTYTDEQLVAISLAERRTLLTKDRSLLRDPRLQRAAGVRSNDPRGQLQEVVARFQLENLIQPLTRCLLCNVSLVAIPKAEVLDRIPPLVRENQERFTTCPHCRRVFWEGTHYRRMTAFISTLVAPGAQRRDV